ncbi:hypothetical protein ABIC01_009095 [Bradyrhizobium sp. RT4b]
MSFASSFTPMSRAADSAGEAPGRPGLNGLRLTRTVVVPPEMLESLKRISNALPGPTQRGNLNEVVVAGVRYKVGETPGYSYEPNPRDVAGILRNIRQGKQLADFCIATNHGHEPGNWSQESPDYEQSFAHQLIDAGADAYLCHGPHQLRGVEIYKDRPIFYGVGNFIMDDLRTPVGADMFASYGRDPRIDTDAEVTAEEMGRGYETDPGFSDPVFYQSIVTASRFEQNRLAELRLYPIELGHSERFANRGIPRLAPPPLAKVILERLRELSKPFGTQIIIEDDIGLIRPRPQTRG